MRKPLCVLVGLLSVALVSVAWAGQTMQLSVGATTTALSTELNSLTNNNYSAASAVIDNRIGQTGAGALICRVEASITYAANPTAGGAITGWFLRNVDGTNYETTPTTSIGLNRAPDFIIPVVTGQTATRSMVDVRCAAERMKVVVQNTATGQSMAASGNTVKILFITIQSN